MGVTPHQFETWPSARAPAILHRSAIAAVDRLTSPTTAPTLADLATGGSLVFSTNYKVAYGGGNRWGPTMLTAVANITLAADATSTHSIRVTIPQVVGGDYYDIFLSVDAAPKWVGRVTEAQRAAGDYQITAVGTVAAGGGNPAGTIDVDVVGTGIATTNTTFSISNAYTPASVTPVQGFGFSVAHLNIKVSVTDLRSAAPTLVLVPFFRNPASNADWHQGALITVSLLTALGMTLEWDVSLTLDGVSEFVVLISTLTGQGAAVTIWVERA